MTGHPTPRDWLIFALLTMMWGSAYGLIGEALKGLPPEAVVAGRLSLAAVLLLALMRAAGERLQPFSDTRAWAYHGAQALTGFVLPFLFISHAQQEVSSSLAALFLASVPILVAASAPILFASERMNRTTLAGVLVGFAGMVVMVGPAPLREMAQGRIGAQMLLLGSAVCYAASMLVARGTPVRISARAFAAGAVSLAALFSLIPLALADWSVARFAPSSLLAVVGLAVFPSALAQVLYLQLIRRTSAGFVALNNYTVPVFASVVGVGLLGEQLSAHQLAGFGVVLAGVWLAQAGRRRGLKGGSGRRSP